MKLRDVLIVLAVSQVGCSSAPSPDDSGGAGTETSNDGGVAPSGWASCTTPVDSRCFSGLSCGMAGSTADESRWAPYGFDAFDRERTGVALAAVRSRDGHTRLLAAPHSANAARTFELRSFRIGAAVSPGGNALVRSDLSAKLSTTTTMPVSTLVASRAPGSRTVFAAGESNGAMSIAAFSVDDAALTPTHATTLARSGVPSLASAMIDGVETLLVSSTGPSGPELDVLRADDFTPLAGWSAPLGMLAAPTPYRIAAGDLDGDGSDEVVLCAGTGAADVIITTPFHGSLVERTQFTPFSATGGCEVKIGNVLHESGTPQLELLIAPGPADGGEEKIVVTDRCGAIHHTISVGHRHEQASWSFNGSSASSTLPGDPTGLTLEQAFLGTGQHVGIDMISGWGGHYFRDSLIAVDDPLSATPVAAPDASLKVTSAGLADFGWRTLLGNSPPDDLAIYVSVAYNQWSIAPNTPWLAPDPNFPGTMNTTRFLTLDPDQFVRLNDGTSWRDIMYPGFDPSTASTPVTPLFYWNLSNLTAAGAKTNWAQVIRSRIHADRMARVGTIFRTWPHLIRYLDFGGELEQPSDPNVTPNRLADYGVFTLAEFHDWLTTRYPGGVTALNAANGTSFATFDEVTPPWGRSFGPSPDATWNCIPLLDASCGTNPWWETWQTFRKFQIATLVENMAKIAVDEGIPTYLVSPHQIAPGPQIGAFSENAAITFPTADPVSGRLGIDAYGAECTSPELIDYATQSTNYWGVGEFNPWPSGTPPTKDEARATFEAVWAAHPNRIQFHTFSSEFGLFAAHICQIQQCSWDPALGISPIAPSNPNYQTVIALQEFMAAHKDEPRLGFGQGVSFEVADVDGDGLDDVVTNLGSKADAREESIVDVWHTVLAPLDPSTLPTSP